MPINESGYTLTVGPDRDGNFFEVAHGDTYDLPQVDPDLEPAPGQAAANLADSTDSAVKPKTRQPKAAANLADSTTGGPTE